MTTRDIAEAVWCQIRDNLMDRSMYEPGEIDGDTESEIDREQIQVVLDALREVER